MTAKYFGPCRAGLHPELGWGTPCLNDASEYVEVFEHVAADIERTTLMRLCGDHSTLAEKVPGFQSRRLLGDWSHSYPRTDA